MKIYQLNISAVMMYMAENTYLALAAGINSALALRSLSKRSWRCSQLMAMAAQPA